MSFDFNQSQINRWVAAQAAMVPTGSRVLDVGAGAGPYRQLFAHCEYRSQDFAQVPGFLGKYTTLDYVSDIKNIPVPDSSFDFILCTEVLEHVPEPILAVREMARILRPGGKLLLTAPLGSFLHQEPYHFYGGYTPYWYKKFLPQVGLDIISIEPNRGFFIWFAQEAQRFSALVDPRRTLGTNLGWLPLSLLWLITLPFCRMIFPLFARILDKLGLEHIAMLGIYVIAEKQADLQIT